MKKDIVHDIELYLLETFKTLFEHEVRKSRRYKYPLTLIHIAVQAEPNTPETQHAAEMIAINALDSELRDTDIPCRNGHEFLVLLPSTDQAGGLNACERLEKVLHTSGQTQDGTAFQALAFIGLTSTGDDLLVTSAKLLEQACTAMEHAHTNHSLKTVVFSDIK